MLARATRDRHGRRRGGARAEAGRPPSRWREDASEHAAIVLASGGLGLISLPERDHRLTIEEIEGLHPGLIGTLVDHPGIGFVMVRSDGDGAVVLGAGGRRAPPRRSGDRRRTRCSTSGRTRPTTCAAPTASPTAPTSSSTASTTPRPTRSRRSRSSWARTGGSAAGRATLRPGPEPSGASPRQPIVGVQAMHDALRGWLAETGLELRPHSTHPSA